jgi:hypothetical protein
LWSFDLKLPRGMIVARWDDRMGVTPEANFPEGIGDLLEHDDLLTIFSTHALTEKPGILAMRVKRLNITSYYSGLPEGEKTEQFFVVLILENEEDPNTFEERLTEIAKLIISSVGKPGFQEVFAQFYDQLIKMEKISEEQRYAFIFRDDVRALLLTKLTSGPMTKDGLAKWLSKEIDKEVTDIDSLLAPLKKTELIEEINVSKGKKVSLEYVFLMRDVATIRVPNVEIFKAAKSGQMPEDIRDKYIEEVEKFFKEYRISTQDAKILGDSVSNPDQYEVIQALRTEYCTRAELPMKLPRDIAGLEKVLKELAENKIISAVKDKKDRVWVFLLSDIKFPTFFPEYMIDVIRRRWKEGTIAKEIALKHLDLLRAEYIATQAPKYRRKLLKNINDYFINAETLIKKKEYEQGATILDTMAGMSRDMGERGLGELLEGMGKSLREDKERYIEEKFPADRESILALLNEITERDTQKKRKTTDIEVGKEKKVSERADQAEADAKKKKKKQEDYKEPEKIVEVPKVEPQISLSASMDKVEGKEADSSADPKQHRKQLAEKLKQATKDKDLAGQAEILGEMANLEDSLGNKKDADLLKDRQNKVAIQAMGALRADAEKEAKAAEKNGDYKKAAVLWKQCKDVSNALFKSGVMNETDNVKKYGSLEADAQSKQ